MTEKQAVTPTPADAAINRVLESERAARDEITGCRRQALAILREARARARVVSERTERRINRVHTIADRAIDQELSRIDAQTEALDGRPELTPALLERLDGAIEALVDEMVGTET